MKNLWNYQFDVKSFETTEFSSSCLRVWRRLRLLIRPTRQMLFTRLRRRRWSSHKLQGGFHQTKSSKLVASLDCGLTVSVTMLGLRPVRFGPLHGSRTQRPRKPTRPYLSSLKLQWPSCTSFSARGSRAQPPASRAEKPAYQTALSKLHLEAHVDSLAAAFRRLLTRSTRSD